MPYGQLLKEDKRVRRESLFLTRTNWAIFGVFVLGLIALVPFALAGHTIAEDVLLVGAGGAVSFVVAELAVRWIGDRKRAGLFLLLAWIPGLILPPVLLLFVLPYDWIPVADASVPFPVGGHPTPFYLFYRGALYSLPGLAGALLTSTSTSEEARKRRREACKALLVVGIALMGFCALYFGVYVLIAYVAGPILRFFLQ